MGLFDIFSSAQPAAPAPQPVMPGNIPAPQVGTQQSPGTAPNGTVPAGNYNTPVEVSPLAEHKDLWQSDPNKQPESKPITSFSPEDVTKTMQKVDFSSVITPAHMEAISLGGEAAQIAYRESLNALGRAVMVQATLVNSKLTEQAVAAAVENYGAKLPSTLRAQNAAMHAADTNPLFLDPAVKPVIEATRSQLLEKYPQATPAQITELTHNYILSLGKAFAPKVTLPGEQNDQDWDKYLAGR